MTMLTRKAVRGGIALAGLGLAALLGACADNGTTSPSTGAAAVTTPVIPPSNADAMRRQGTGTVPGSTGGAIEPGPVPAPGAATPGRPGTGGAVNTVPGG
jgi:hypothetical protein